MSREDFMNDRSRELEARTESRIKQILETAYNKDDGVCVKDVSLMYNIAITTARKYIIKMLERELLVPSGKEGKTMMYKPATSSDNNPTTENAPIENPTATTDTEKLMPVGHSGKEFEPGSYIQCGDTCRPGDVVWVSSRSGEGAFFRYLVITPWEHKAMVLGIFEEGHPKLNLNDPYYVYIGDDPEKGVKLYADIRNNCQRGYKQFGERLMRVDKDLFDDVKARLARSMGFDPCKDRSAVIERLRNASDKQKESMTKLREENERLKQDLKNSYIHQDEYKKAADDATELNRKLSDENDELQKKYLRADDSITQMHRECSKMSKELDAVNKENADLRQQISAKEVEVVQPRYDDDTVMGMIIDSEVKKAKIEVYEEEIKMLKQMVFNMIKSY